MYSNHDLSEKDLLFDLMTSEKQLSTAYNNAILETSCPVLRDLFFTCLTTTQNIHYALFNVIDDRGWNKTILVSERDIERVAHRFLEA